MFANAIIKGCMAWAEANPIAREWVNPLLRLLEDAAKIYIGSCEELFNATNMDSRAGKTLFTDEVPSVRPPFRKTLIMYTAKSLDQKGNTQLAMYIDDAIGDGTELDLYQLKNVKGLGWVCYPTRVTIINTPGVPVINNTGKALPVSITVNKSMLEGGFSQEELEELHQTAQHSVNIAYTALLLMSCKNITTQDIVAPEKQQKARARKGQLPIYTYKVLSVKCPSNVKRTGGRNETESPGTQRLHVCRGHFKEYTADAPLLGKAVGRYWWQPMVRGHVKNGIVDKDYNIKTK